MRALTSSASTMRASSSAKYWPRQLRGPWMNGTNCALTGARPRLELVVLSWQAGPSLDPGADAVRIACVPARMMQDALQDCSRQFHVQLEASHCSNAVPTNLRYIFFSAQCEVVKTLSEQGDQARTMNGRMSSGMHENSPPGTKRFGSQQSGSDQVLCTAWRMGHARASVNAAVARSRQHHFLHIYWKKKCIRARSQNARAWMEQAT